MSSSSYSNPQWVYDVFLSFRGKDTRSNFVSHLHAALSNAGINAFVDYKLHKGTDLGPELMGAIEKSHISIIVFSKTYIESTWCLNELEKIMECRRTHGHVVMPVFYDIDPSVVRHQQGAFGKTLQATAKKRYLERELRENVLSSWSSSLTQAANLSGWDVTNC
ncbi:disease resistance protein (TIR-NBS-LRR class), partial [Trifolium pratense]